MSEPNHAPIPIFDGHNDTLLSLKRTGRSFFERSETGHVDLPRARAGGLAGGFFAVWSPDPSEKPADGEPVNPEATMDLYSDVATMPPPLPLTYGAEYAMGAVADLLRLEAASAGAAKVVRSAGELRHCLADGVFAMLLHFEGAEPIDPNLDALEVYHRAGLRSLGLVWSRPNRFAHGVPFQFPASPDTGPGLTDLGKDLVRACNRLRILLDVSHLNEQGFWDLAALSDAPLVATHAGAHALCPSTRNLTDKQLDAIRDAVGMVGVNFHVGFLRADGADDADTPLTAIADHLDYLIDRLGVDRVGLGSDFDGATMPADLRDAAGLPKVIDTLRERGYDDSTLRKIASENWVNVLERTWGS